MKFPRFPGFRLVRVGLFVAVALAGASGCDETPKCRGDACRDAGDVAPDAGDAGEVVDGGHDAGQDAGQDAGNVVPCANLPPGLYVAGSCSTLAMGVRRFEPAYVLWSDGATKERFVYIPPGSHIDANVVDTVPDPDVGGADYWVFPMGTVFWKHFSVGATRVETRMLKKVSTGTGVGAWELRTFVWNDAGNDVTEVTTGMQNARGTSHDIPNAPEDCISCHATRDVALGFSALQLNGPNSATNETPLTYLLGGATPILSPIPSEYADGAAYVLAARLPTAATPVEAAALGYLHANCGNCHGAYGLASGASSMRLFMPVGHAGSAVSATPTYDTTVNRPSSYSYMSSSLQRIAPDSPGSSAIRVRMMLRDPTPPRLNQMPPLGTEMPDSAGLAAIDAWINSFP